MKKNKNAQAEEAEAGFLGGTKEKPIEMLKQDHKKVKELFEEFENAEETSEKKEIVQAAISELKIHAAVEEEIFYPAAREEMGGEEEGEDLLDEALEEHHVVKLLIAELEDMEPEDERFDAKFTVLAENVKHHIKEEESEMFPELKTSEANKETVAARMMQRKQELQSEIGEEEPEFISKREQVQRSKKKRAA